MCAGSESMLKGNAWSLDQHKMSDLTVGFLKQFIKNKNITGQNTFRTKYLLDKISLVDKMAILFLKANKMPPKFRNRWTLRLNILSLKKTDVLYDNNLYKIAKAVSK